MLPATPELSTKDKAKAARLLKIFNQTLEEHNVKRTGQKNACAICRRPFTQYQPFQDHDHKCCARRKKDHLNRFCGKCNRGLLCFLCNRHYVPAIEEMLKDEVDPQRVVQYVIGWSNEIKLKGGYAPKVKAKTPSKVSRKQKSVRRSPSTNATGGPSVVVSESRRQSGTSRSRRFSESCKAKHSGVLV